MSVSCKASSLQVELVAIMGDSYKGDIAIDDLAFKDCAVSGE